MRIQTVAEELVRAGAITLTDGASSIVEGPAGYGDAKRDERFFFEAAGEFLPAILFEEVSRDGSDEDSLRNIDRYTHVSLSKEEGRGASDIWRLNGRKSEKGSSVDMESSG